MDLNIDGKRLAEIAKHTFGTTKLSKEQLLYILTMLNPSSYLLKHHRVKGHPITFHVSGHDSTRAHGHRPWQVGIINDQSRDKAVIKSRQLGL